MKIAVLIKRVPDTASVFKVAADEVSVETAGIKYVLGPYDEHALEEWLTNHFQERTIRLQRHFSFESQRGRQQFIRALLDKCAGSIVGRPKLIENCIDRCARVRAQRQLPAAKQKQPCYWEGRVESRIMKLTSLEQQALANFKNGLAPSLESDNNVEAWIRFGLEFLMEAGRSVRSSRLGALDQSLQFKADQTPSVLIERTTDRLCICLATRRRSI